MWQCSLCLVATNTDESITCVACEALKPGLTETDKTQFHLLKQQHLQDTIAKFRSTPVETTATTHTFAFGVQAGDVQPLEAPFVSTPKTTAVAFGWNPAAASEPADAPIEVDGKKKRLEKQPAASADEMPTGKMYVHGSGECEQLGLGEGVLERKKPTLIKTGSFVKMAIGALHNLGLSAEGRVFSWGCNDDGALGRKGGENEPGEMEGAIGNVRIVEIAAGDSHSLMLDSAGGVWFSGVFKDSAGHLGGLHSETGVACRLEGAWNLSGKERVVGISSGFNHAVILTDKTTYVMGNDEFGQLGSGEREADRIKHTERSRRRNVAKLKPHPMQTWNDKKMGAVAKVWCTGNATYVRNRQGDIFVCGLNNSGQLGMANCTAEVVREMQRHDKLSAVGNSLVKIVGGSFHSIALQDDGHVLAWGRADYCGVGLQEGLVKEPTKIAGLSNIREIAAGSSHCVACDKDGDVFLWGFGETYQLGNYPRDIDHIGEEPEIKDELTPYLLDSKQLKDKFVFMVGAGAQHSVELAWDGDYVPALQPTVSSASARKRRASRPPSQPVDEETSEVAVKRTKTQPQ